MKRCNKCKRVLPKSKFHRWNRGKDGLKNRCRECRIEDSRKYYTKNIEKIKKYRQKPEIKKRKKQHNKTYREKHKKQIQLQKKEHYITNREEILEYHGEYHQKNKKKIAEYGRAYRQRPEVKKRIKKYRKVNRTRLNKQCKEYHKKHKEETNKRSRSYARNHKEEIRKQHQENPEVYRRCWRKRQLKKKQLYEEFTIEEWQQKVDATEGICPICNRPFSESHPFCATMDHTPPISKAPIGLQYTIDDINPICSSCNSSKGNNLR